MEFGKFLGDGQAVLAAMEASSLQSWHLSEYNVQRTGTSSSTRMSDTPTAVVGNDPFNSSPNNSDYETDGYGQYSDEPELESNESDSDPEGHGVSTVDPCMQRPGEDGDPINEPAVGMSFGTEEAAHDFFKMYAIRKGFACQKRSSQKIKGTRFRAIFICSRGRKRRGQHPRKKLQNRIVTPTVRPYQTRKRGIHSTLCQCRLVISDPLLIGKWTVDFFHAEHNHGLKPRSAQFFRSNRELPEAVKRQLEINDLAGVPQKHSFKSIVATSGGFENCTYITRDLYNYIIAFRKRNLGDGDASSLIEYFKKRQISTPTFFYECSYDGEGHLERAFWADARARAAYTYFGDVVSFDTTYLTNKYGMPFSPFVGVNQHGQTILLGYALLSNETTESYVWLLETWVTCMGGRAPQGILTDQCYAMKRAIDQVLPKIGQSHSREHVLPLAQQLVYNSLTEDEFDEGWMGLIDEFPETDRRREWFSLMFDIRHSWVPIFLNKHFWAGMSTTQRSESINSLLDGFVSGGTPVHVFAWQYAQAVRARLQSETLADFNNFNEMPELITNHPFEHQISRVYTTKMLYVFQDEVKQLININSVHISTHGSTSQFSVTELCPTTYTDDGSAPLRVGRSYSRTVSVDTATGQYTCPCNMFNFRGVVCRHALAAYSLLGMSRIPDQYLLNRWSNYQARTDELDALLPDLESVDYVGDQQLYTTSHGQLLDLIQIVGTNETLRVMLKDGLASLKAGLQAQSASLLASGNNPTVTEPEQMIKDPKKATPVGRPRTVRLKAKYDPSSYRPNKYTKKRTQRRATARQSSGGTYQDIRMDHTASY